MLVHIALALQMQADPSLQPRLEGVPVASNAITDAAGFAVLSFLTDWRTAWLGSVDWRGGNSSDIRLRDDHCHWDGSYSPSHTRGYWRPPNLIHRSSRRSMCPDWFPADEHAPDGDERVTRDVSLSPEWRDRVHMQREALLDSLNALAKLKPADAWITGERVRFFVDQGDFRQAVAVARDCTADRAWCLELTGFALDAAGDYVRADSAFDAAGTAMTPEKRCKWTSVQMLLDDHGQSEYDHMSCDERIAANRKFWWLTTPLFSDTASDRRSEDFARKVLVELHAALPWDERFDWRERYGGEALSEMLVRYGWPAYSVYGGNQEEASHASWMGFYDSTRTSTAEYPMDRLHLAPQWTAVEDPFHASADAWQLNMPALNGDDEPAAQWWPAEHYARTAGGIVQLTDQTVMLRRDTTLLLATAAALHTARTEIRADTASAVLIRTTSPSDIERLKHQTFKNEHAIVLTANILSRPAIVGAELPGAQRGDLSARTRFGITPPPTLSTLKPGEAAISDPVLIGTDDAPPPGPDEALQHMLGSTRVRGAKVGIYWETYGYAAGDSVDVAVVITRHEPVSKVRRIGMLLHLAHDLNGSVAVRWGEPTPGHSSWTVPGVVPIQARSIRLDLSRIEPGHYSVQVLVGKHGSTAPPLSSSRDFVFEGT
jgi:hypothetical protein